MTPVKPEVYAQMFLKLQAKDKELVRARRRVEELQTSLAKAHKMIGHQQREIQELRDSQQRTAARLSFA